MNELNFRVIYINDCANLKVNFFEYLLNEILFAFINDKKFFVQDNKDNLDNESFFLRQYHEIIKTSNLQ